MRYFVAVWKGWNSLPLLLEPVRGLWPEVTAGALQVPLNVHQHGGGRGEDGEMDVETLR